MTKNNARSPSGHAGMSRRGLFATRRRSPDAGVFESGVGVEEVSASDQPVMAGLGPAIHVILFMPGMT
jgi:hypothetical protein